MYSYFLYFGSGDSNMLVGMQYTGLQQKVKPY